jgi:uncharacterized membrane protein YheB (UPF0754 family)
MKLAIAFIVFPLLGAAIGWITNWLAVKMLFRPRNPMSILGIKVQGLLPRRQHEIAETVGGIVERELINMKDIRAQLESAEVQEGLHQQLEEAIRARLEKFIEGLNPMMRGFITPDLLDRITGQITDGIWENLPELLDRCFHTMEDKLRVEHIVREKVDEFDIMRLESIAHEIAAREFKLIEVLGGVLGAVVGVAQGVLYITLN